MITPSEFANYFNFRKVECILDTRDEKACPSAVVFFDEYEDIMLKADFLEGDEILYTTTYFGGRTTEHDFTEITRRLNVLNTITPCSNVVYIDGRLIQQYLVDTSVTGLEELYDIADYNVYLTDNASKLAFCNDEALSEMLKAAQQNSVQEDEIYE